MERLRTICIGLCDVSEGITFGHPTFRVNGRMFCILEEYKGELGICVKVEKELQGIFLNDPRFFRTPYNGKVYAARLSWTEVKDLVRGSHRLVAASGPKPKKRTRRKRNFPTRKKAIG